MSEAGLVLRVRNKVRRVLVSRFSRRQFPLPGDRSYVSFTFDDFPRSALVIAGDILRNIGAAGTYYAAISLLGRDSEVGRIATADDLRRAISDGHEVGCHTFHHLDGAVAPVDTFRQSLAENALAYERIIPGGRFQSFAYPFDGPRLAVKRGIAGRFTSCRGGGQTANTGSLDLDLLKAYFVDRRNTSDLTEIKRLIRWNASENGWLVFATHDVVQDPGQFGCSPDVFEKIVRMAVGSGSEILTVSQVCERIGASKSG